MNGLAVRSMRGVASRLRNLCTSSGGTGSKPPTPPPPAAAAVSTTATETGNTSAAATAADTTAAAESAAAPAAPAAPTAKSKSRARNQAVRAEKASARPLHPNQAGEHVHLDSQRGIDMFLDVGSGAGARRTGRSWRPSELRLKSFADLHKLWYVLLKERNVLLTERAWCKTNGKYWTNGASNLYKVKESMTRVKCVVAERITAIRANRAAEAIALEKQGLAVALEPEEEGGEKSEQGEEAGEEEDEVVDADSDDEGKQKQTVPTHKTPRRNPRKWPEVTKSGTPLYI